MGLELTMSVYAGQYQICNLEGLCIGNQELLITAHADRSHSTHAVESHHPSILQLVVGSWPTHQQGSASIARRTESERLMRGDNRRCVCVRVRAGVWGGGHRRAYRS